MKSIIQTLFFLLLITQICFAQWEQLNGPYINSNVCFAVSGTNLFIGTGSGVFLSTDNGFTWIEKCIGLPKDIWDTTRYSPILCIISKDQNLFVGTHYGVYLSTDNGNNWKSVNDGIPKYVNNSSGYFHISCLASIGQNLFAGTWNGVFLTTNNGINWTPINSGLTNLNIFSLAANEKKLFAGTSNGVFLSTNNGTSWIATDSALADLYINCLHVVGSNVIAGTSGRGIYFSSNDGTNWIAVNDGLPKSCGDTTCCVAVNCFASFNGNIIVETDAGMFISFNECESWDVVNSNLIGGIYSFVVTGMHLFAGTPFGIYRTSDVTGSWNMITPCGYGRTAITALAVGSSELFVSASAIVARSHWPIRRGCIFRSTDNGESWEPKLECESTLIYLLSNEVFISSFTGNGIFRSSNHGATWTSVNNGLPKKDYDTASYEFIHCFTSNGINLFAGTEGAGVFLLADTGANWKDINEGLPRSIRSLLSIDKNLFAGTVGAGVFLTTDKGTSWKMVNEGLPLDDSFLVSCFISIGQNLFIGTNQGVFLSTNSGINWPQVDKDLTVRQVGSFSKADTNLFATSWGDTADIYLSKDNGMHWQSVGSEMIQGQYIHIDVNNTYLYAANGTIGSWGSDGTGLWRRKLSDVLTSTEQRLPYELSTTYKLYQNYPNPFNPTTKIKYAIPQNIINEKTKVKIVVFDILGKEITTLVNEHQNAGNYEVEFNAGKLTSGVYFYKLQTGEYTETKKMVLIR